MNPLRILLLLLLSCAAPAAAGLRATYAYDGSRPLTIEIADNEDFIAELTPHRRLLVSGDSAFIVEDRLTGPVVMRLADLQAVVASRRTGRGSGAPPARPIQLIPRGPMEVNGWTGAAFAIATPHGGTPERLVAVISDDPMLAPLGRAMRRVREAEDVFEALQTGLPTETLAWQQPLDALLDAGTPLRHWGWTLRTLETAAVDAEATVPPGEPESPAAVAARYDRTRARAEEAEALETQMISRAVFAAGRLWLLTDNGALTSIAEGETRRARHDLAEPVADICEQGGAVVALTGDRNGRGTWSLRRLMGGQWQRAGSVAHESDSLIGLSCSPTAHMVVTNRRLIDLGSATRLVRLSEPIRLPRVRGVVHVAPDAVFIGLNAGEWGGGLMRVDRRSGQVATIERNATGERCDGPLNSSCDPVNGLAAIPWRPGCIAGAIGLIHFMAHGRIAEICPGSVEQLAAVADVDLLDPEDARRRAEAATGGYGSVAFFGLATRGSELLAVGHNGLHRFRADGSSEHERWPRFTEVDGVYVSFALPDVVLVLTQLNRRASVSGSSPLLVVR